MESKLLNEIFSKEKTNIDEKISKLRNEISDQIKLCVWLEIKFGLLDGHMDLISDELRNLGFTIFRFSPYHFDDKCFRVTLELLADSTFPDTLEGMTNIPKFEIEIMESKFKSKVGMELKLYPPTNLTNPRLVVASLSV